MKLYLTKFEINLIKDVCKSNIDCERDCQIQFPEAIEQFKASEKGWKSIRKKLRRLYDK